MSVDITTWPEKAVMTAVYLVFDAAGDLLYVGHTIDVTRRIHEHRTQASWGDRIARVDVEEFASYSEALWVERLYIADLEPEFNVLGNPRFHPEPYEVTA